MKIGDLKNVKLDLTGGEVAFLMTALLMLKAMGGTPTPEQRGYDEYVAVVNKLADATKLAGERESA